MVMLFYDEFPVRGDELIFRYRSGMTLKRVMDAFEKFYAEYNPLDQETLYRTYDSERSGLVFAMSGGGTFDMVDMFFSDCGENKCRVRFFAKGTTKKSTENGYNQVRKFFEEWAIDLLEVERWGERPDTPLEGEARHLCQNCGSVIAESEASYCWHCGAAQASKGGEGPPSAGGLQRVRRAGSGRQVRSCLVCGLGFEDGDLLAWCPFCGAAAHRLHLLEFLHVKENCPACGHHLDERDLSAQLGSAHLSPPRKPPK